MRTVAVAITEGSVTFDGDAVDERGHGGHDGFLHVLGAGPDGASTSVTARWWWGRGE